MSEPKLNEAERSVLIALSGYIGEDGPCCAGFDVIVADTRLSRDQVSVACRSLAAKGLAKFVQVTWTDEGKVAGAGYRATEAGRELGDALEGDPQPAPASL